jgi:hypothetical protein
MTLIRQTLCALLLTATLLLQSGCATGSRADFCELYQPVYMARGDTEATKKQINKNNAVWVALCERKSL